MRHNTNNVPLICLLLITLLTPVKSIAADSIAWMEAIAPPFFIHEGPFKGQGYENLITDILIKNLPQYTHTHMQANVARHYQQWKQGEKTCALAMYKTPERKEFAYFSIPSMFTLPTVLIIRKDRHKAFGNSETASLSKILQENNIILGRSNNRSYGVEFDKAVEKYGNEHNIYSFGGAGLSLKLFKLLLAGRIDALPGLPEEAMYLAEQMGIRDKIMTLAIEENQINPESWLGYVTCSKTDWGKKTIANINEVLLKQRPTEHYRAAYERWLDPGSIPGFRRLYKDVFLKITE